MPENISSIEQNNFSDQIIRAGPSNDASNDNGSDNVVVQVSLEDVSDVSENHISEVSENLSNILQEDLIIQIERAVGEMPDSVFNESVTNADQILTRSRSARSR